MCRGRQAAIAAVLAVVAGDARADALAEARAAIDASDYMTARDAVAAALRAGTVGPAELAEAYKLTGIVEGALGNAPQATAAFAKWLSLDPKGTLPAGTSPKIARPLSAAQQQLADRGKLEVRVETADDPPAVTLVIANDPQSLVVGAKVYFIADKKPEQVLEASGKDRITIELGLGKRIDLRLHAIDKHGNRVVELGSIDVPLVITSTGVAKRTDVPVARPPEAPPRPRPWYLAWWAWGGAAAVSSGAALLFGLETRDDLNRLDYLNANSLAHTWSEAQAVEARARRHLLVTNITAVAAGVFAAGALALYVTRPDLGARESATVTAVPTRGGGALVLGGTF